MFPKKEYVTQWGHDAKKKKNPRRRKKRKKKEKADKDLTNQKPRE